MGIIAGVRVLSAVQVTCHIRIVVGSSAVKIPQGGRSLRTFSAGRGAFGLVRLVLTLALWSLPLLAQTGTDRGAEGDDRGEGAGFPDLNLYLPEGEFDIRVRKLIKNVLFEGQVNYNFVDGDVSTFLRYKYYARNFAYKIGVFDTIEFESIDSGSEDFDRVRGTLLLFDVPREYNRRYVFLLQGDSLAFGDVTNVDHDQDNVYLKIGYQRGTPFDERLNSIAGETRGRVTPVLTAYREIGPDRLGFAGAITQGFDAIGGDYSYTKVEAEVLKRYDFRDTFLISRLHVGSFLAKDEVPGREDFREVEQYSVPRYEYFRLGGRDALKAIDDNIRGSDEIHLSNEYFFPIFRDREIGMWRLTWNDLYGIGYVGGGNVGFDSNVFTDVGEWIADAGLGFEAGLTFRNYEIFLTAIYARTVTGPDQFDNDEFRVAARTRR